MQIDIHSFTLLKKTIKMNGWLELPAFGNSMFPFIQEGNTCRFVSCRPSLLKKGDIVLYYSQTGQLVAHRFVKTIIIKERIFFVLKGDTNMNFDPPIEEHWILGKLISVHKKQVKINSNSFISRAWSKIILSFPAVSGILRNYLNKKLKLQY